MRARSAKATDWSSIGRYALAFGGCAFLAYFAYEVFLLKHIAPPFKYASIALIAIVGILGAGAILQRESPDDADDGRRLYTAEEVAELLNAVRSGGGAFVAAADRTPAVCIFCGESGASVRGLDGTHYHRACFQRAYREREAERSRA